MRKKLCSRLKFKFSKIQENVFGLIRAKAPVSEYKYSPPLRSASAKSSFPPYFLRTKSNKKPGNPSSRFPDPPWRSKGNNVPLRYPLPTSPFGQYKAAPSGRLCRFLADFGKHQINHLKVSLVYRQNHLIDY